MSSQLSHPAITSATLQSFINRWKASAGSERANYQLFLTELCELLDVEKPQPASGKVNEGDYCFERTVTFNDGEDRTSTNFIDLYKRDCFVLEAKQGSDKHAPTEAELLGADRKKLKAGTATRDTRAWDRAMKAAKEQALRYARSLPAQEGWPPFLVVTDVGYCIDLYADFARQGKTYVPFPGPQNYRIMLEDLAEEPVQQRLRQLFTEPLELDPSRKAARVTRQLAGRLAKLAASLEESGHSAEKVSGFLMRCLFTMFAEDTELLPKGSFSTLLSTCRDNLINMPDELSGLWQSMDKGGYDRGLHKTIPQFNGFLFKDTKALPLSEAQLDLLILAAEADWSEVEPSIFGTLLERALQPRERHKLGAHYTPRAYVERLVMPTVIEPLREEWNAARTASAALEAAGQEDEAGKAIREFHRRLCQVRVLDPACGSGNFLYVTLDHLKRLEGEVLEVLGQFPGQLKLDLMGGFTVSPAQFLGLEVNPRAAAIADVVLWIGYLQWHSRTHGKGSKPDNPILREYGNIRRQDAVLSYSGRQPRLSATGEPVTRWDGISTRPHPVTGQEVPDETARTVVYDYLDPKPAEWPEADFIVGNPPFIGHSKMRDALGDGYTESIRKAYKNLVPESADFVMYWWHKAAELVRLGGTEKFGFITTNSIKQSFNRRVIEMHMKATPPLSITLAIPDHPWVDYAEGAAVEIAMTIAEKGELNGRLLNIISETKSNDIEVNVLFHEELGRIHSDLTIGAEIAESIALKSNIRISCMGVKLHGLGFVLQPSEAEKFIKEDLENKKVISPYITSKDLAQELKKKFVIDLFGLTEKALLARFPLAYQHVLLHVKPERDQNNRASRKENWWLFGETNPKFRDMVKGLDKFIATSRTAKHRVFQFLGVSILVESEVIVIASDDAYILGILSSKIHEKWALAAGSDLGGNTPRYNNTLCFEKFPFPTPTESQKEKIRSLAEQLDAHRKQQQAQHPTLTITDLYNVLEKLRSGEALSPKERLTHEQGLVSVLLQLHQELDAAVAEAYNWPTNLSEEEILTRLVALNKERSAEEARGLIRYLRPEYQNPAGARQSGMDLPTAAKAPPVTAKEQLAWPKTLAEQAQAVQRALQHHDRPATAKELAQHFSGKPQPKRITEIDNLLATFHGLGLVRLTEEGAYVR